MKTQYVTNDGKIFDDRRDAEQHEEFLEAQDMLRKFFGAMTSAPVEQIIDWSQFLAKERVNMAKMFAIYLPAEEGAIVDGP